LTPSLLDADVFIRAKRDHYRFAVCPGFWDWLIEAHRAGQVYSIDKIRDELLALTDDLSNWVKSLPPSFFLSTDIAVTPAAATLSAWTTSQNYERQAVATFFSGGDYWLIAHALTQGWRVVTHEVPAPGSKKKVKIPDACDGVGVACIAPFQMLEELGARFTLQQ
jgi:hypothetical protein